MCPKGHLGLLPRVAAPRPHGGKHLKLETFVPSLHRSCSLIQLNADAHNVLLQTNNSICTWPGIYGHGQNRVSETEQIEIVDMWINCLMGV